MACGAIVDGVDFFAPEAVVLPIPLFSDFLTLAQRAFCAAAIFARASALIFGRALALAGSLAEAAFFAPDSAVVLSAFLLAAVLTLAHRAFCPAAIFARASGLMVYRVVNSPGKLEATVCRGLRCPSVFVSLNSALTRCKRDISASISTTILWVSMYPPLLMIAC